MAAALAAGTPTDAAVALAARGCGPPLDGPLRRSPARLRLGAAADEAWRLARDDPVLRQLARLAVRSAASGAAMADACRELAAHAREAQVLEAEAAIKRAGVLSVLPVALCLLPAFVLVGVVPIVVGLLARCPCEPASRPGELGTTTPAAQPIPSFAFPTDPVLTHHRRRTHEDQVATARVGRRRHDDGRVRGRARWRRVPSPPCC